MLVDDHPLVLAGIRALISQQPTMQVAAECGTAKAALEGLRKLCPHLVVLDITLPGGQDGIELVKRIATEAPQTAILVFSMHDEVIYALRAISAGARGYLMKDASPETFCKALHSVLKGEIVISSAIAQRLARRAVGAPGGGAHRTAPLSDRELEVLLHIGQGHSTEAIAQLLGLSVKTVESHRLNLRRKLALQNANELLRYAVAWVFEENKEGRIQSELQNRIQRPD